MILSWDHILFGMAAALAAWALLKTAGRRSGRDARIARAAAAALIAVAGAALLLWRPATPSSAARAAPQKTAREDYVSSDTCLACHPDQYASWHRSYHRTMTQVASPETIRAPMQPVSLEARGLHFEVEIRNGDEMWVRDDQWPPVGRNRLDGQIVMTTGSHHQQMYWIKMPDGGFQQLSWIWVIDDERWVPSRDAFVVPRNSNDGNTADWKACMSCHTTASRPRLQLPSGRPADSRVAELGIACEMCHGPAGEHVRAHRNPLRRYAAYLGIEIGDGPLIVHPKQLTGRKASQVCAQCHSDRREKTRDPNTGNPFKPGDPFREHFRPTRFDDIPVEKVGIAARKGLFWDDGTSLVNGREHSGMSVSKCFTAGDITCNSCHSIHRASDDADELIHARDSDVACTQCHESHADRVAEHTHHEPGSPGAACLNCHMPNTTYGMLKMTRSHRIDSPTIPMSTVGGRPNACNLCHVDRSLEWTQAYLGEWYGQPTTELTEDQRQLPASALWLLGGDVIQRVTTAWHLGWKPAVEVAGSDWSAPLLARALDDSYSVVRYVSGRSLRRLPGFEDFEFDYIEAPEDQHDAVRRALAIASRGNRARAEWMSAALLARLEAERDDTPITVFE